MTKLCCQNIDTIIEEADKNITDLLACIEKNKSGLYPACIHMEGNDDTMMHGEWGYGSSGNTHTSYIRMDIYLDLLTSVRRKYGESDA